MPHYPTISGARITSPYGYRKHPITGVNKLHTGTDFAPPIPGQTGVPIFAVMDGIVRRSGYSSSMGNFVYLEHTGDSYTTVYMHMARTIMKQGSRVRKGQQIGVMGTTGQSTGIHLHLMVSKVYPPNHNGVGLVNPLTYLKGGKKPMLKVDGRLGPATIKRLQQFLGTPADGKISEPSAMIKALQVFLNQYGR